MIIKVNFGLGLVRNTIKKQIAQGEWTFGLMDGKKYGDMFITGIKRINIKDASYELVDGFHNYFQILMGQLEEIVIYDDDYDIPHVKKPEVLNVSCSSEGSSD